jgi:trans-aconitate 2-methyltransferase
MIGVHPSNDSRRRCPWPRQCVVAEYTFGDGKPAIRRLSLVADAYEPVSRAFLQHQAPNAPRAALDLGCGPGFSTRLLASTCRPGVLIGLDSSEPFLQAACAIEPTATFEQHDVTRVPLPHAPADLIYARLVLAHLPDPPAMLERWRQQLTRTGVLLSEELEGIEAPAGPLRDYDEMSAEILQRGGGVMYAGPLLAPAGGRCVPVTVSAAAAARMYMFNVRLWLDKSDRHLPREELLTLKEDLRQLAGRHDPDTVSWIVRQSVIAR